MELNLNTTHIYTSAHVYINLSSFVHLVQPNLKKITQFEIKPFFFNISCLAKQDLKIYFQGSSILTNRVHFVR